jgi:hypothetical protein
MVLPLTSSQVSLLFGGGSQAPTLNAGDRVTLYRNSIANADKDTARLRKDPAVVRDLARLDKAIAKAKTPDDLFKDPETVRVLLQSLGLADQAQNIGLARKALLSDPADKKSLAATLTDKRWKDAAATLAFATSGLDTLRSDAVRSKLSSGYVDYKRLSRIGEQSQAVSDSLYIRQMEAGKTPGVYDVLGNKVLRRVAQTVAGLPDQLALQEVEAQARTLQRSFKLSDFGDAKAREKLIQRYLLTAADTAASSTANATGSAAVALALSL